MVFKILQGTPLFWGISASTVANLPKEPQFLPKKNQYIQISTLWTLK